MTKAPVFCQESDTVSIAAKLMLKYNIGAVPVVAEKKLVGIWLCNEDNNPNH